MEMLVCIVNEPERLYAVISTFLEYGIHGSTIIESQGMGRVITDEIPIFTGFRHLLAGVKPFNYTILSAIEDPTIVDDLVKALRMALNEGDPHAGILFTVPINRFVNLCAQEKPDQE